MKTFSSQSTGCPGELFPPLGGWCVRLVPGCSLGRGLTAPAFAEKTLPLVFFTASSFLVAQFRGPDPELWSRG